MLSSRFSFFSNGQTCELLNDLGTCDVPIEIFTILVNIGKSSGKHSFNNHVGLGSNSHDFLGE